MPYFDSADEDNEEDQVKGKSEGGRRKKEEGGGRVGVAGIEVMRQGRGQKHNNLNEKKISSSIVSTDIKQLVSIHVG